MQQSKLLFKFRLVSNALFFCNVCCLKCNLKSNVELGAIVTFALNALLFRSKRVMLPIYRVPLPLTVVPVIS